ncbi:unnamed protein product [Rotaria socialis]|uniref:DNA polymerase kappa n=1 Tax=Rotaria socialis TaxID=392032 RepID=A0A821BHZ1_9BILA|nr:unnamed protein product [Rotaria socialis]
MASYEEDLRYLKEKVDYGADFIITRLFFQPATFIKFESDCRSIGIQCRIIPGIFPIQAYASLKNIVRLAKLDVPEEILACIEPIKYNGEAIRNFGVQKCVDLCRTLLDSGKIHGLHFYTLNREYATIEILRKLDRCVRPKSYVHRTSNCEEFPNGRWGLSFAPSFGVLTDYHLFYIKIDATRDALLDEWGHELADKQDVRRMFACYIADEKNGRVKIVHHFPWKDEDISPETNFIHDHLIKYNRKGILTISSQPAVNGKSSTDSIFGRGIKKWLCLSKKFFTSEKKIPALRTVLKKFPGVNYHFVNKSGEVNETSTEGEQPIALIWGVFAENMSRTTFLNVDDTKAGMEDLDKEKINKLIQDASKNSKFFKQQQRREEDNRRRIEVKLSKIKSFTPFQIEQAEKSVDRYLAQLDKTRDLSRTFCHIDMDAFYAAVEMRDNPALQHVPMAVGGESMLSTSNYLARQFGVRAAMPGFIARHLCPNLVIVRCDFEKYRADSVKVIEYDENYGSCGLDEAFADLTNHLQIRTNFSEQQRTFPKEENSTETITFGMTAEEVVQEMRHRIHLATRLTASAGIACNMRLAKLCSDINKPNGQYQLESNVEVILNFIRNMPIRKIKGIGKVTALHLESLEIQTVNDIYLKRGILKLIEYPTTFDFLMRVSNGCGSTTIEHDDLQKSVGHETTFNSVRDSSQLISLCRDLAKKTVDELISHCLLCKRVTLKIKTVNFENLTRSKTLSSYTDSLNVIADKAVALLKHELDQDIELPALRLMGVRVADLKMKSSDLPILQFFSKKSTTTINENVHDVIEDIDNVDEDEEEEREKDENENEEFLSMENSHLGGCDSKLTHQDDEDSNSSTTACPVCQKLLLGDNEKINKHIDLCLNGEMVRTTIKEENRRTSPQTKMNKRIQLTQSKSTPPKKRQKRKSDATPQRAHGIDNYFFKTESK